MFIQLVFELRESHVNEVVDKLHWVLPLSLLKCHFFDFPVCDTGEFELSVIVNEMTEPTVWSIPFFLIVRVKNNPHVIF